MQKLQLTQNGSAGADATRERLYSRVQLARLVGVSIPTIKRWEKAGVLIPIRVGPKIVRYSEANVNALLAGK